MTLRVVQAGNGDRRDLVVVYHLAAAVDETIRRAVGPSVCVLNETCEPAKNNYTREGPGALSSWAALLSAALQVGAVEPRNVVLCGFSEGCQGVRYWLQRGVTPSGIVAIDGVHAGKDLPAAHLAPWRVALADAEQGVRYLLWTHTAIQAVRFASTTEVARAVWGERAFEPGQLGGVAGEQAVSGLAHIWRFPGMDAAAHREQGQRVLPGALGDAIGFLDAQPIAWSGPGSAPPSTTPPSTTPPSTTPPSTTPPSTTPVDDGTGAHAVGIFFAGLALSFAFLSRQS